MFTSMAGAFVEAFNSEYGQRHDGGYLTNPDDWSILEDFLKGMTSAHRPVPAFQPNRCAKRISRNCGKL